MPINNLSQHQIDEAAGASIVQQLQSVLDMLNPVARNLTPQERQQYGSINERNKLIINKANDYHQQQPMLKSPDVDWLAFDASWKTRTVLAAVESLCESIREVASDTRIIHDYDLYQMTLTDYDYTKYKANISAGTGGFTTKHEEMKQFFGNPGGNNGSSDTPEPATE